MSRGHFFKLKNNALGIRRYLCDYLELKEKSNIYGYVLFEICSFPGSFCRFYKFLGYLEGILGAPIKYVCSKLDFFGSSTQISSFWYHKSVQIPCNNMRFHVTILFLKPTEVLKPIGNVWEVEIHPFRHVGRKKQNLVILWGTGVLRYPGRFQVLPNLGARSCSRESESV